MDITKVNEREKNKVIFYINVYMLFSPPYTYIITIILPLFRARSQFHPRAQYGLKLSSRADKGNSFCFVLFTCHP